MFSKPGAAAPSAARVEPKWSSTTGSRQFFSRGITLGSSRASIMTFFSVAVLKDPQSDDGVTDIMTCPMQVIQEEKFQ